MGDKHTGLKIKSYSLEHHTQVTAEYLTRTFERLRDQSPEIAAMPKEEKPTFHEIRSLGARLAKANGLSKNEIRALAGHTNTQMTDLYLHNPEMIEWNKVSPGATLNDLMVKQHDLALVVSDDLLNGDDE